MLDDDDQILDPQGQPDDGEGADDTASPTVKIGEVEISSEEFERLAKEKYQDRFDAFDNRDKWQAKLTQEAQQNSDYRRKAEQFDQLRSDPRLQPQDRKSKYVEKMSQRFPDLSREFLNMNFDEMSALTGATAKEAIDPIVQRQGQDFERRFLEKHPEVSKGSDEYFRISNLIQNHVDPEDAYQLVFKDTILKSKIDDAVKAKNDDAKRKLKNSSISGRTGTKPKGKTFAERSHSIIDEMYDG